MKAWVWPGLGIVLVAGLSYAAFAILRPPQLPGAVLYGNGHIEGTEVRVSAEVSGRVIESGLREGTTVSAGDVLVRLDATESRARLAKAQAEVEALEQSVLRARSELRLARHHLQTAEKDLRRLQTLRRQGSVSPQQLSHAEDRFRETDAAVKAGAAGLREVQARLAAAQQEVRVLKIALQKTVIRAPVDGSVLTKSIEMGELAVPGRTVAVLVDLTRLDLKVFIPERALGKVSLGAPVRVRVDAFPARTFEGRVTQVEQRAQFTPRDIHLPEERVTTVFGVKVALANPDGVLKPGIPADAWILWDEDAEWPDRLFVPR